MATPFKELFHQGVVTARDASLLDEGELARADDCIYRPNDPAIFKAPGRTAYGTVKATIIASVTLTGTSMTKANAFGTTVTSGITEGDSTITSAAAFTSDMVGQRVYGTGIANPTYVRAFTSSSSMELDRPATATNASASILFSNYEPGDFVKGTNTAANTRISSVTDGSTIVLDTAATTNGTDTVTIAPTIKELLFLSFPGTNKDRLLAYSGSRIYESNYTGATGSFSSFITGLTNNGDEIMEAIKAGNKYILLSTRGAPRVVQYKDVGGVDTFSQRLLGLRPVESFSAEVAASGQWPSALGNGYYFFLVTEMTSPDEADEAEGTYSGTPQSAQITSYATQSIVIRHPITYNSGSDGLTPVATHWRVYMSPVQASVTETPALHLFRRVATVSIDQTSITLSDSNPITPPVTGDVADFVSPTVTTPYLNPNGVVTSNSQVTASSATFSSGATSGSFVIAAGTPTVGMPIYGTAIAAGTYATSVSSGGSPYTIGLSKPTTGSASGTYYLGPGHAIDGSYAFGTAGGQGVNSTTFGFRNDSGNAYNGRTVVGIEVRITYKWDNKEGSDDSGNDRGFNVALYTGGSLVATKLNVGHKSGQGTTPTFGGNRWGTISCGGPGDTWGRVWSTGLGDFTDASTFKVNVVTAASAQTIYRWIDSIDVIVYFTGVNINLDGAPFPTIIYTSQIGEQVTIGAAGPPPACDTGDIFEGQLIVNDTNNPTLLWASIPDEYEQFPTLYQLNVTGRYVDPIRVFRKVGGIGVIFCQNSIKRLNYFPTEADADSSRGRAWEDIADGNGTVSKRGVATFDYPGRGVLAAYVSPEGLMLTDGITVWPANVDLDWSALTSVTNLDTCKLVNYPAISTLALYYVPAGASYHTRVIYFNYHPSHLKDGGRLAAVGPVQCRARSAVRTNLGNISKLLSGNLSDGKAYVEDSGNTSEDLLVTIAPVIRTRQIYGNDVGGQARIERGWLRVAPGGNATTGAFSVAIYRQNIGEDLTSAATASGTTDATTITGSRLVRVDADALAESIQFEISKADLNAPFALSYISLLGEGYGLEKNRA